MKTVIIHGQNHEGSTCMVARELAHKVGGEVREFFLPRDFNQPCRGCYTCFKTDLSNCPHFKDLEPLADAMLEADLLEYDVTVFLTGTALNFVDHRMKNVIDRILPLATMYIHIVDGQCRHVPRYEKKLRLGLLYSGTADGAYLNRWMDRVALNLGGESLGSYPIAGVKEVLSCI